jgi:DNA polymerase-3 subunit gamma/tau
VETKSDPDPPRKEKPSVPVDKDIERITPSISLTGFKNKISQPKPEKDTSDQDQVQEKDYSRPDLEGHLKAYAEELKTRNKSNQYTILNRDFELQDHEILFQLDNPVQLDLLEEFRLDLVQFLRKKLNNRKIQIKATFTPEEGKKMIYTQKEKFEHLASKQPLLKELNDRLGLDPDF